MRCCTRIPLHCRCPRTAPAQKGRVNASAICLTLAASAVKRSLCYAIACCIRQSPSFAKTSAEVRFRAPAVFSTGVRKYVFSNTLCLQILQFTELNLVSAWLHCFFGKVPEVAQLKLKMICKFNDENTRTISFICICHKLISKAWRPLRASDSAIISDACSPLRNSLRCMLLLLTGNDHWKVDLETT